MALHIDRATDLAVAEIRRMAELCGGADPSVPVPSCPGWDLAKLLSHAGTIPRWAALMVEQSSQERLGREKLDLGVPAEPTELAGWVGEAADFVEPRFRAADPDTAMWAWGWPKAARFWPRRMVHEIGVHRADAELALGAEPSFDADVAADGVDELLDNLPHAAYFAPKVAELRGGGEVLALATEDLAWAITLHADGFEWSRAEGQPASAAARLTAPTAGALLLTLYGRRPPEPDEIDGDASLVQRWLDNSAL